MTDWAAFAGFAAVVLSLLLVLARLSQRALPSDESTTGPTDIENADIGGYVNDGPPAPATSERTADRRFADALEAEEQEDEEGDGANAGGPTQGVHPGGDARDSPAPVTSGVEPSTTALLANVLITQGLFLGLVLAGLFLTGVPLLALGVGTAGTSVPALDRTSLGAGLTALALGAALGVGLAVANQIGASVGERFGLGDSEALREALTPESAAGWALLLGVVLPVIAVFEELLFRGVLVGALAVGAVESGIVAAGGPLAAVLPWVLVVLSSLAFALGHGAQGRGGIVVTGVLGGVLATAFVLTWSLPLVVVAHYLVNALEFVVHEGSDVEWI